MPARDYERRIERIREGKGAHGNMDENHREILCLWADQLKLDGKSPATLYDYIAKVSTFLRHGNVPDTDISNLGKGEVNSFLADRSSGRSVYSYKAPLRQFFLWYYLDHIGKTKKNVPRFVEKQLKDSPPRKGQVKPEDVPEKEEVTALMEAALNGRDRALIALLADKGMRISEALSLDVGDVHFDRAGVYVMVPEAKKQYKSYRKNRLTFSRPAVKDWMDAHPRSGEDDAPLFTSIDPQYMCGECGEKGQYDNDTCSGCGSGAIEGHHRRLKYDAARAVINSLKEHADVRDHITLHKFRHYSATEDLKDNHMKERYIVKEHGWDDPSMLDRYGHLTDQTVDQARIKQMVERGELPPDVLDDENGENGDGPEIELIRCPNCHHENSPERDMCNRCNQAFTEDAVDEQEEYRQLVEDVIEEAGLKEEIMQRMRTARSEAISSSGD